MSLSPQSLLSNTPGPALVRTKAPIMAKSPFDPKKRDAVTPRVPSANRRKVFYVFVRTLTGRAYLQHGCLTPELQDATFFHTKAAAEDHLKRCLVFFHRSHHGRFMVDNVMLERA